MKNNTFSMVIFFFQFGDKIFLEQNFKKYPVAEENPGAMDEKHFKYTNAYVGMCDIKILT